MFNSLAFFEIAGGEKMNRKKTDRRAMSILAGLLCLAFGTVSARAADPHQVYESKMRVLAMPHMQATLCTKIWR